MDENPSLQIIFYHLDKKILQFFERATMRSYEKCWIRRFGLYHIDITFFILNLDRELFKLYSYVERKIADVMRTGSEDTFGPLTGYERKKVHAYVGDKGIEWLRTFSQDGENGERILHIAFDGEIDVSEAIDLDAVEI